MKLPRISRLMLGLPILMALAAPPAPALAQAAPCQFVLGFKALHDLDTPDIGDCQDNQAFAANGDAQQHTTKGLMAWRKADNWTAFTNGYMTWINGPNGLVSRLNTDRFPWEAPAPSAAPAAPAASAAGPPLTTKLPTLADFAGLAPFFAMTSETQSDPAFAAYPGLRQMAARRFEWTGPPKPSVTTPKLYVGILDMDSVEHARSLAENFFSPQMMDALGTKTQFILFNGAAGQIGDTTWVIIGPKAARLIAGRKTDQGAMLYFCFDDDPAGPPGVDISGLCAGTLRKMVS